MAKPARTKPLADPRKLADEAVREYFDAIIDKPAALTDGSIHTPDMEQAFERVTDALLAEHKKLHGAARDMEDAIMAHRMMGIEAGYLIGVRMGLRLRGGAR